MWQAVPSDLGVARLLPVRQPAILSRLQMSTVPLRGLAALDAPISFAAESAARASSRSFRAASAAASASRTDLRSAACSIPSAITCRQDAQHWQSLARRWRGAEARGGEQSPVLGRQCRVIAPSVRRPALPRPLLRARQCLPSFQPQTPRLWTRLSTRLQRPVPAHRRLRAPPIAAGPLPSGL